MQDLRLVAANDVGSHLLLRSMLGEEFRVPIDERLRAAVRGDRARFSQLEIELDSQLRPRDIQARIRAGQSAEEVAHAAGVPVERVRRFEGPVLAERAHMAQMAQRSSLRRGGPSEGSSSGPSVVLGTAVAARLDPLGVRDDAMDWDSWRRDDGRWIVLLTYLFDGEPQRAHFVYDPRARTTTPDDDEARWLVGDLTERPAPAPFVPRLAPAPDLVEPAEDRVAPVPPASAGIGHRESPERIGHRESPERIGHRESPERPRRASALDILMPPPPAGAPVERRMPRVERSLRPEPRIERPEARVERPLPRIEHPAARLAPPSDAGPAGAPEPRQIVPPEERLTGTADAGPERQAERPTGRAAIRGRRPSVPSWDEILFGTRRGD
jgi:hypothetical protein